jgi:hypothetical protein
MKNGDDVITSRNRGVNARYALCSTVWRKQMYETSNYNNQEKGKGNYPHNAVAQIGIGVFR